MRLLETFGSCWRRTVLLPALLVASIAHAASDGFVLAGQSNMVGCSTQAENTRMSRVTSPDPDGLVSRSFRLDHKWVLANEFPCHDAQCSGTRCAYPGENRTVERHPQWIDQGAGTCVCNCGVHVASSNQGGDAGRGSAWPTFAAHWMRERGREVAFVATAIGGQSLVSSSRAGQPSWDPDAMDCASLPPVPLGVGIPSLSAPGELYCRMLEAVRLSGLANLRAVLWHQGESDAGDVSFEAYELGLERLADHVWADLGVPMIVAPISRKTRLDDACVSNAGSDAIHDATIAAALAHPHILLGPDTDDLVLESDCAHIHDVATLGDRWFEAVTAVLPACNDGLDNDGDGWTDHPEDPGCRSAAQARENPSCQNGLDDDGDGAIDFDGGASAHGGVSPAAADLGCKSADQGNEGIPNACGLGVELPLVLLAGWRRSARGNRRSA